MMKKLLAAALCLMLLCFAAGCGAEEEIPEEEISVFRATVTEISGQNMMVTPEEGSFELNSSDLFSVPIQNMPASPEPVIGDTVEIEYSGGIMEIYPACLGKIISIKVIRDETK